MLGMCKPCSPCCNDGNDITVPECQAPGVSINMQCSFLRSVKCSQMVAKTTVSTAVPTLQTNQSTAAFTTSSTVTSAIANSYPSEPLAKLASPRWRVITGSVVGGVFIVFILPLVITICYFMAKRKRACKKVIDLARAEKEIGESLEQVQGKVQANEGDENETDEQNPAKPVQETCKSEEQTGIQESESRQPRYHSNTDFLKLSSTPPEPSCGLYNHTTVTAKNATVTVCIASSGESTMV
ncbi:hypothetical protein OS493_027095 [Desmophyllum pertusum]|uniref:TNFR-Cys domain-containing protein n=1 Tax=Desmophyllum pertusum TaxID=174260 RepID=A0A9W9Y9J1_9CNID|nr:hypothetical protein OS493_027095 [Desmophyllum pertusum]